MSQMKLPLVDQLQDPADEAAIHRIALAIDARVQGRGRRRSLPLVLVGSAAAVVALTVAAINLHRDAGPLLLAGGQEIVATEAGKAGSEIALSDGSRIRLAPGARFEPLENTGARFSAIVARGCADFDVRPDGPRHWTVECGLATVEVVGTAFTCERAPGKLRVVDHHGVVLVRGEHVPDRARRLSAGESLDITEDGPSVSPAAAFVPSVSPDDRSAPAEMPTAAAKRETVREAVKVHAAVGKPWRELARNGRHREAFAVLGSEGLRRESEQLGVGDLLALADVARLSGHPAEAVMPLERILAEFANDSQAPLAAFALGRLDLDSLGRPRAAASAFRKAIELGIPSSLREDVLARLVEACARSGDVACARRAADAYRAEFPSGRHARAIQGWLRR
jgi:transmembrane sensor